MKACTVVDEGALVDTTATAAAVCVAARSFAALPPTMANAARQARMTKPTTT